ncbi:hypothetical protein U9M48_019250 [Paspalum notatum var. saurae]|uniref:NAD-dependent epimerase/dehydratase domain-containing protein n=1 Tax=Paspalum notatum var. saurae TaxID=547442 RepID=A0AAQ3TEM2_PASNO
MPPTSSFPVLLSARSIVSTGAVAMRSAVARLIHSSASVSPPRLSLSAALLRSGNAFSSNGRPSDAKHINEPLKVEEAESVKVPPLSPDKLLVLGGSGFVGSHVCKEAVDRGLFVSSLNRSGKPSISESWAEKVVWNQGNLLEPTSLKDAMDDVSAVVKKIWC